MLHPGGLALVRGRPGRSWAEHFTQLEQGSGGGGGHLPPGAGTGSHSAESAKDVDREREVGSRPGARSSAHWWPPPSSCCTRARVPPSRQPFLLLSHPGGGAGGYHPHYLMVNEGMNLMNMAKLSIKGFTESALNLGGTLDRLCAPLAVLRQGDTV
ncbi:Protein RUFY3 [Fukomys damarensis]|uniref:Protein RUFY3 n=1 Tax=Fukomys damarensis TaxID=885580 RepID=A0A091DWM4_FUKDA|nr:Protein RUFY3 [Fukomys damarensis]